MSPEARPHPLVERLRRRKRRHRERGRIYRLSFAIGGFAVLLSGIVLSLPLVPGPGLLLIAVGLAMLALEFAWAERWLERAMHRLEQAKRAAVGAARRKGRSGESGS